MIQTWETITPDVLRARIVKNNEINKWRKRELAVNVLLIAVALLTLAKAAWGL